MINNEMILDFTCDVDLCVHVYCVGRTRKAVERLETVECWVEFILSFCQISKWILEREFTDNDKGYTDSLQVSADCLVFQD